MADDRTGPSAPVALVVGASSGIGHATAARLSRDGYRVAAMSRRNTAPAGVLGVTGDITSPASLARGLARVKAELGDPQVLVVTAGRTAIRPLLLTDDTLVEDLLAVNVVGPWRVVRAVAPAMARFGSGRIILTSSLSATLGAAGQTAYAMGKAALIGMAQTLSAEVVAQGITVNIVVPGFVDTPMTTSLSHSVRTALASANPRGRPASADEVAAAISFLSGPEAAAISGAVLPVDGGEWINGFPVTAASARRPTPAVQLDKRCGDKTRRGL